MIVNLNMRDAYRASDVNRWSIVRTQRGQTVAEHSYHVAMIAMRIADLLDIPEETRGDILWAALTHDMAEVLTGDLATPLKDLLGPDVGERLRKLESEIKVYGRSMGPNNDGTIQNLIKMADLVEATAFISAHGMGEHADAVGRKLVGRVVGMGPVAVQVLDEILYSREHTLDDMVDGYET